MFMRITRGTFDVAAVYTIDAMLGEVEAALARLPGHDHTHIGMDRAGGRSVTVTTWDTEEHARFSRDQLGDLAGKLRTASMVLEPPEIYALAAR